jgi:hypothetical protein
LDNLFLLIDAVLFKVLRFTTEDISDRAVDAFEWSVSQKLLRSINDLLMALLLGFKLKELC